MTAEKTKEEILESYLYKGKGACERALDDNICCHLSTALKAMQEYSDQQNAALMAENQSLKTTLAKTQEHINSWDGELIGEVREALTTK